MAFAEVGISLQFTGKGVDEKGIIAACNREDFQVEIGKVVVSIDPAYFRPTEVELLIGDATKARTKLGWKPQYDLPALVKEMMESDVNLLIQKEAPATTNLKMARRFE